MLQVRRFVYEYGDRDMEIDMIVTGEDLGRPEGYQVWPTTEGGTYIVDDQPTMVTNPIREVTTIGGVRMVVIRNVQ